MSLLIHSISELRSIVFPLLEIAECKRIVEIGGEHGGMTTELAERAKRTRGFLVTIDPAPQPELTEFADRTPEMELIQQASLKALFLIELSDAYLIDGDHNYFTVIHELAAIWTRHQDAGKLPLILLHDVGWPWAYRDLYYTPEAIPADWRHPHSWDMGVTLDNEGLVDGGFRGEGNWAAACHEGGPRNGVRKAIEDFLTICEPAARFHFIPAVFGLGVLFPVSAPWADAVTSYLAPYDHNPLLEKLERNRLMNYLRVIELQDQLLEQATQSD